MEGDEEMKMEECRKKAAQAWCTPETEDITMNPYLAEEFARILYHEQHVWRTGRLERLLRDVVEEIKR
jgi:hypothetical protein